MTDDLEKLAYWCRVKADDPAEPIGERHLWAQIAGEVSDYLGRETPEMGLFDEPN